METSSNSNATTVGLIQAMSAYFIWGLFPLYWMWLKHVPAGEVMAHRIVWSFVILFLVASLSARRWVLLKDALRYRKTLAILSVSAVLISINWLLYIWAVYNGYVLEASMGYYINPLVNILLGAVFLHERLRRLQYVAVFLAFAGVVVLALTYSRPPWIALGLAFSFGFYALFRKTIQLDSQTALLIETSIILVPAVLYLTFGQHSYAIINDTWVHRLLLVGGGLVTIVPLILLSNALKKLNLSTIGILQYTVPTLLFLYGIFLFDEEFNLAQAISFALIWSGLAIYIFEAIFLKKLKK